MESLTLPTLPSQKTKNYLSRLADALGTLHYSKNIIQKQYDDAKALLLVTGETEVTGEHWAATVATFETSRLDQEKLERFLKKNGRTLESFKTASPSSRVTLKPVL